MKVSFFILIVTIACAAINVSAVPGIKVAMAPSVLADFLKYHLPTVIERFQADPIPDIVKDSTTISNITIKNMCFPSNSMNISFSEDYLSFATKKFGFSVGFDYQKKILGLVPISFYAGGSINNSELAFDLSFYLRDNLVEARIKEFSLSLNNLTIHSSKDSDKSYINSILKGPLKSIMTYVLSNYLRSSMEDKINLQLSKVPRFFFVSNIPIVMDYKHVKAPSIHPEYLVSYLDGTFYDIASTTNLNNALEYGDFPEFNKSSKNNFQIFISEHLFNSAAYATWKSGYLNITIDSSRVPEKAGFKLNVRILKQFVPEVSDLYDDSTELLMNIAADSPPLVFLNENDIQVTARTVLTFYAISEGGIIQIVSVESTLEIHAVPTISISEWTTKPLFSSVQFGPFNILYSKLGDFDPFMFERGLNLLLEFAVPAANAAKSERPLPAIPIVDLPTTTITVHNGYIQIEAYPRYKNQAEHHYKETEGGERKQEEDQNHE